MSSRRSSSSSSSSSETVVTSHVGDVSRSSENITQTISYGAGSPGSYADTTSVRSITPSTNQIPGGFIQQPINTINNLTAVQTGGVPFGSVPTNIPVPQQQVAGNIPIIRPPVLQQQQPTGIHTTVVNQPIRINVPLAQQQYQQHAVQPQISPSSGSTVSISGSSLSSPGSASLQQQPRVLPGNPSSGQFYQQQQTQFINQIPKHQVLNELPGAHSFADTVLHIDYGAIEAYNFGMQSSGDLTAVPIPPGVGGGRQQFDVAKALFNQADVNRDGVISRQEFQQWAQGGMQHPGGPSYTNYGNIPGNNSNYDHLYTGADPTVANILRQSGL